jgi:hypothetical protein
MAALRPNQVGMDFESDPRELRKQRPAFDE